MCEIWSLMLVYLRNGNSSTLFLACVGRAGQVLEAWWSPSDATKEKNEQRRSKLKIKGCLPATRQLASHWHVAFLRIYDLLSLVNFSPLLHHLDFIKLLKPVHLFLHKLERGLKSFHVLNIQALNSKFHTNEWFSIWITF